MANLQEPRQIEGFASTPRRWKPYPAYKPSSVNWLGAIPAHWEVKRLKYVAPICDERAYAVEPEARYIGLEHIESATGRLAESASDGSQNGAAPEGTAAVFRTGDVLFGKLRPYLSKVFEAGFDGVCSTELLVMRPTPEITSRFLAYTLLSKEFIAWVDSMTYGTKMPRASPEQVTNTEAPLPPVTEQRAIVAFLDRETAKIDALVAKKERLIELLQEKRAALITHAVTKGLNPSAPMKPSGVEWLGQIPAHWEVAPIYARYDVALGKMLDAKQITGNYLAPYLRNVDVQWDRVSVGDLPEMDFSSGERVRFCLQPGDLLVCEGGEVGRTAMWRGELAECYYQKAIHRLRPLRVSDYPRFFFFVMYAAAHGGVFAAGSNPNTIDHLTAVKLRHYRFPFPPRDEQESIASYLDGETAKIDTLIGKVHEHTEKLKEYRAVLVSAAVTGKIDVRQGTG